MDVEKLIEAAEHCIKGDDCIGCIFEERVKCPLHSNADRNVLDLKLHYEALLASERSKVIAEVKHLVENIYGDQITVHELYAKLDSMAGKVDEN